METHMELEGPAPAEVENVKDLGRSAALRDASRVQRKAERDEHLLRREARVRAEKVRWE